MGTRKTVITTVGAVLGASLGFATPAGADDNPFAMQPLDKGYQVAAGDEARPADAKPGDARPEGGKKKRKHGDKKKEGKCGEGKCGEGKCGGGSKS